jgi:hypothetical protein
MPDRVALGYPVQDDSAVRASDRARDRTALTLSRAAGEGLLSIDTLTWRLDGALRAKDLETLDGLVGDLPLWLRPPSTLLRNLKRWVAGGAEVAGTAPPEPLRLPENLDAVIVGRSSSCDVRLSDQSVSRRHAQLRRQDDGWRVVDLLSTNGTFLNGRQISSAVAFPGDQLGFGLHLVTLPR